MAKAAYRGTVTVTDTEAKQNHGGIEQKVIGLDNRGRKVMLKSMNAEKVLSEYLCSSLARKLGLRANEVKIFTKGDKLQMRSKWCSVHTWVEDFEPAYTDSRKIEYTAAQKQSFKGWSRGMKFLDWLIENCDRHDGNYGRTADGRLMLIDHGHCNPWSHTANVHQLKDWCGKAILEADLHGSKSYYKVGKMFARFARMTRADFEAMVNDIPAEMKEYFAAHGMPYAEKFVDAMILKQDALMGYFVHGTEGGVK